MKTETWNQVDQYLCDTLHADDDVLRDVLKASAEGGLPPIQVAPNQGKLLMLLAQSIGARRVLEIGTLGGYSTIWMARALPSDGKLITLEYEPKHAKVALANIERAGLSGRVEVRVGRGVDLLPVIASEKSGPFDMVFIDADKAGSPDYFTWAMKLTRPGSLIILDNVVRDGKVFDADSDDASVRGIRGALELMGRERRVLATAIQTVGVKGYDGFAIARVIA